MRKTLLGISVALLALGAGFGSASGAENPCKFESQFDSLAEAKKRTESVKPELEVRKALLAQIMDCAMGEAQSLQKTVADLNPRDRDMSEVKDHYGRRIEHALDFYEDQKAKVGDLGIQGSKNLAKEMLSWRASFYKPLSDASANLVLWLKNQNLFLTADQRFNQIGQTVRTLKLLDQEEIAGLFAEAEGNLAHAKDLNAKAKTALKDDLPPGETSERIKGSLAALAATYESFFNLSEAVKKLLPI